MGAWERFSLDIPKIQVLKDFANHILIMNERDHAHSTLALGACEWIDFVNLLNQPLPVFSARLVGQLLFKDAGEFIVDIRLYHLPAQPFSKLHYPFLMAPQGHLLRGTGRTKMATFA